MEVCSVFRLVVRSSGVVEEEDVLVACAFEFWSVVLSEGWAWGMAPKRKLERQALCRARVCLWQWQSDEAYYGGTNRRWNQT